MTRKEQIEQAVDANITDGLRLDDVFIAGARWADRTMIERACQWLEENLDDYLDVGVTFLVSDFKQAMQD